MGLAVLLGLGLLLGCAALTIWTMQRLTRPLRRTYASAVAAGRPGTPEELPAGPMGPRGFRAWSLRWRNMDLPVWEIDGDRDDADAPVLVLTHGWGDSRIGALARATALFPLAARVVLWDMPGHGEAPGRCALGTSEYLALRELLERIEGSRPIVLVGWSLGAGVSIAAASKWDSPVCKRIVAIVAEAPYRDAATPARAVLQQYGVPHAINLPAAMWALGAALGVGPRWRGFDRAALARRISCPLLVLHGADDAICPAAHGAAIADAAARGRFVEIAGGGHHGLWTTPQTRDACVAAVRSMLESPEAIPVG